MSKDTKDSQKNAGDLLKDFVDYGMKGGVIGEVVNKTNGQELGKILKDVGDYALRGGVITEAAKHIQSQDSHEVHAPGNTPPSGGHAKPAKHQK